MLRVIISSRKKADKHRPDRHSQVAAFL